MKPGGAVRELPARHDAGASLSKPRTKWAPADFALATAFIGGALLVDQISTLQALVFHSYWLIMYAPGLYLEWAAHKANSRMLSWHEPPPEPPVPPLKPSQRVVLMLTLCAAFAAGWVTKSLDVYVYVAGGISFALAVGFGTWTRLWRRGGITV